MATQRRVKRSTAEIRGRLVDAARELFLEKGYDATTTRDICARSGVAQTQLFANFGSKEGIFEAAFVTPFVDLVNEYIASWSEQSQSTVETRVRMFIDGLYDLAQDNRTILLAAVARHAGPDAQGGTSGILDHLARALREMEIIELPGVDTSASIIAAAGMVFGVALLDNMLFPAGSRRVSRSRLTDEMVEMILHGVLHREDEDPPTTS